MDIEKVKYERDDYKHKMNLLSKQLGTYEKEISELKGLVQLKEKELIMANDLQSKSQAAMVNNLTESNTKMNLYIENIQTLKATIRGMRQEVAK